MAKAKKRKRLAESVRAETSGEAGPPPKKLAPNVSEALGSQHSESLFRRRQTKAGKRRKKRLRKQTNEAGQQECSDPGPSREDLSTSSPSTLPTPSLVASSDTPSGINIQPRVQSTKVGVKTATSALRMSRRATAQAKKIQSLRLRHLQRERVLQTLSPHSFVRSRANDIRDSPWLSREEFTALFTWLYSNKNELVSKGVARVAAWSSRGKLPVGVDITAHLCEAFLMEMRCNAGNSYQAMSFGFAVAITRFINGLVDATTFKGMGAISNAALKFDIPPWVIDLRHESSHRSLPSVGRLRAGATFCLRWLKQYYWKQYQDILSIQRPESRLASPPPAEGPAPIPLFPPKPTETQSVEDEVVAMAPEVSGGPIWRLTRGLCNTKMELVNILTSSTYSELAGYVRKKQLLQFPDQNKSYVLKTPEPADLVSFSELQIGSTDLAMWKKHLLKACEQNPCFKQTLISALIVVVNSSECVAGLRDYLCSWLCMLMVEHYQVDVEQGDGQLGVEVVQIIDDDEQFLPGTLDWLNLLKVAQRHAGYYTYTIVSVILQHLKSTLPESTRERILYLTTLVTLSDRIGHDSYIPGIRRGAYELEFRQAKAKLLQSRQSEERGGSLPPTKRAKPEGKGCKSRWSTVNDMSQWVWCPLGLAPGQTEISPTTFDLPANLDGPAMSSMALTTTSMVLGDKGQDAEEEDEGEDANTNDSGGIFSTAMIESIQNQVTIF